MIKDSWAIAHRTPSEVYFLQEAAAALVQGIPDLVDYKDVIIDGVVDLTDLNRGQFIGLHTQVHCRLVYKGFADPIWRFRSLYKLICALIDILICESFYFLFSCNLPVWKVIEICWSKQEFCIKTSA